MSSLNEHEIDVRCTQIADDIVDAVLHCCEDEITHQKIKASISIRSFVMDVMMTDFAAAEISVQDGLREHITKLKRALREADIGDRMITEDLRQFSEQIGKLTYELEEAKAEIDKLKGDAMLKRKEAQDRERDEMIGHVADRMQGIVK